MELRHQSVIGTALTVILLKPEEGAHSKKYLQTRDLARADIFDYIEVFYNRTRRNSHIGGVSPEAFETAAA